MNVTLYPFLYVYADLVRIVQLWRCGGSVTQYPSNNEAGFVFVFPLSSHISNRNIIYTDIQNNEISNVPFKVIFDVFKSTA